MQKCDLTEVGTRTAQILMVDDLDTNREIVEAYLGDNGYSVETVGSRPKRSASYKAGATIWSLWTSRCR